RRRFLITLAAAAVAPLRAVAQGLSKRPVRIVVPYTPGTGPDIVARLLAPRLQARWDQPFFVENRPGASGTIGAELAAKAPPDGHTIMVGPASAVTAPHLYPKLNYDVIKDLAPVTNVGSTSLALLVHKSLSPNNVPEFIRFVKARPGQLNYGSPGNGTHHHFCMELLMQKAGLKMVHVPYKGSAGATTDLIAGHIPTMFVPIHVALPMWRANQVKVLGESLRERHPLFPEIPSLHEQGVRDYDVDLWIGVWAPAGTSSDLVAKYNTDIRAIVAQADMREQLASQGLVPNTMASEQFAKLVKGDYDKWGKVIRDARITAD
ncbi:MAG TPA: tripartite tricarboxylate transporter substrate binding protein, partial [Burkholderiales bacterium]|nr:tripartite tricarboxylate transporter substrate binding protein [Burkholderiales bacterium]